MEPVDGGRLNLLSLVIHNHACGLLCLSSAFEVNDTDTWHFGTSLLGADHLQVGIA